MSEHLQGLQHKRLMHIYYLSDYFNQFHIDWDIIVLHNIIVKYMNKFYQ